MSSYTTRLWENLIAFLRILPHRTHISHKSLEDRDMELKVVVEVLDET